LQLGSCRATKENAIWPNSDFGSPAVCNQKK
jgi:hypothetical protein